MIEFIKKWVAKEKVLISHYVKTLILSSTLPDAPGPVSSSIENSQSHLTKDLAARKNREKFVV